MRKVVIVVEIGDGREATIRGTLPPDFDAEGAVADLIVACAEGRTVDLTLEVTPGTAEETSRG